MSTNLHYQRPGTVNPRQSPLELIALAMSIGFPVLGLLAAFIARFASNLFFLVEIFFFAGCAALPISCILIVLAHPSHNDPRAEARTGILLAIVIVAGLVSGIGSLMLWIYQ